MSYINIVTKLEKEIEFLACTLCGGLVFDEKKHTEFHEKIGKASQAAYSADMMTRPIGLASQQ